MKTLVSYSLFNCLIFALSVCTASGQNINASVKTTATPQQVVEQQIEAWNAHDATAFASTYSDTTRLYIFPDKLIRAFGSQDELQKYYAEFFAKNPKMHCQVKGILALGNTVVVHEYITGRSDEKIIESVVTYKVDHGKITRVYFDYKKPTQSN